MIKLDSDIQEIYEYQIGPKYVQDKLPELEARSRRNNIRGFFSIIICSTVRNKTFYNTK